MSIRLKSVKNIEKITKSMKMVSAAKFQLAERELKPARSYGEGAQGMHTYTHAYTHMHVCMYTHTHTPSYKYWVCVQIVVYLNFIFFSSVWKSWNFGGRAEAQAPYCSHIIRQGSLWQCALQCCSLHSLIDVGERPGCQHNKVCLRRGQSADHSPATVQG